MLRNRFAERSPADRAFERLYQAHAADVYRYALALTGNRSDAEDVTQTTFMNAYRALERGEQPAKPRNWLVTIAHNVCRQRFRQAARRVPEVTFEEDVAEALVPDEETPTAADIQRALGFLPQAQRETLVMRELEGRSYAEIAETLGMTTSAVETSLFRARRALREQLESSLTCDEAEAAISRQLDGRLPRNERGALRAHLRECADCRSLAKSQRAQRRGWKALAALPLPSSLGSLFGGGGAGVGAGIAAKAAVVTVTAVVAGGGYVVVKHETAPPSHHHRTPAAPVKPAAATSHPKRGHGKAAAAHRGKALGHRPAGTHPAHPAHPTHPVKPTHPIHPVHPVHPTTPVQHVATPHPTHPVKPVHHAVAKGHNKNASTAQVPKARSVISTTRSHAHAKELKNAPGCTTHGHCRPGFTSSGAGGQAVDPAVSSG